MRFRKASLSSSRILPVVGVSPSRRWRGTLPRHTEFSNYLNALHYGDESLGALLRGLRERDLEDKTLFVVFGDHRRGIRAARKEIWGIRCLSMTKTSAVPFLMGMPGLIQDQIRARHTARV